MVSTTSPAPLLCVYMSFCSSFLLYTACICRQARLSLRSLPARMPGRGMLPTPMLFGITAELLGSRPKISNESTMSIKYL